MATEKQITYINELMTKGPHIDGGTFYAMDRIRTAMHNHLIGLDMNTIDNTQASIIIDNLKKADAASIAKNSLLFGELAASIAKLVKFSVMTTRTLVNGIVKFMSDDDIIQFAATVNSVVKLSHVSEFYGREVELADDDNYDVLTLQFVDGDEPDAETDSVSDNPQDVEINSFYRMDNDNYADDVQYVVTRAELRSWLIEVQEVFGNVDEQGFLNSWVRVDADTINDDDRLRDNLVIDIERGIVPAEIVAFINDTLLPDALYDVMTAAEAQQTYRLSESTVRRAIAEGYIQARKSGGTWLIMRADAQARWGKRRDTREPVI